MKEPTIISASICIKGELSGEEDLIIQGQVEGTMNLKKNHVTIGKTGRMKGDIYGKLISVEGKTQGNLFGEEKIELRPTAVVEGDMAAPRIKLQEGAKFNGKINMDTKSEK